MVVETERHATLTRNIVTAAKSAVSKGVMLAMIQVNMSSILQADEAVSESREVVPNQRETLGRIRAYSTLDSTLDLQASPFLGQ